MVIEGVKRNVARALCHPLVGRVVLGLFGSSIPSRGLRFDLGPDADPGVAARLAWGLYESSEIRFVSRHLSTELDVVELGGSIGVVASVIARRLREGRRLVAVEAVPDLVPLIRANVRRNAPETAVEVVHGALAYDVPEGETVSLTFERDNTRGRLGAGGERSVEVPALRLSGLLDRLGIVEFALVCDVEGAEWGLVEHDMDALAGCRQMIIELHPSPPPRTGSVTELRERLLAGGKWNEIDRDGSVICLERSA